MVNGREQGCPAYRAEFFKVKSSGEMYMETLKRGKTLYASKRIVCLSQINNLTGTKCVPYRPKITTIKWAPQENYLHLEEVTDIQEWLQRREGGSTSWIFWTFLSKKKKWLGSIVKSTLIWDTGDLGLSPSSATSCVTSSKSLNFSGAFISSTLEWERGT